MNLFRTFVTGGTMFVVMGAILAIAAAIWAYWCADKAVLRRHGARALAETEAPVLLALVRRLAGQAKLPMPGVYLAQDPQPNAFATGRDPAHAAVCVTRGLLETLSGDQLAGVIAHELGHIRNRDTPIMTIVALVAGARGAGLFGVVLAPLASRLAHMSRSREFAADRASAEITGEPLWLASALGDLELAHPAAAFGSHPSTEQRIARLRRVANLRAAA